MCSAQSGYERYSLASWRRMTDGGRAGAGWVFSQSKSEIKIEISQLVFPHLILREPAEIRGESVNALAAQLADFSCAAWQ